MPATPEAKARTRAFARVIGPFLVIVPGIVMVRAPDTGAALTDFFANAALAWITGGLLLFSGLLIIAHHQYWSSLAATLISLFGWFCAARRGAARAPRLIESGRCGDEHDADRADRVRRARVIGLWLTFVGQGALEPLGEAPDFRSAVRPCMLVAMTTSTIRTCV